MTEFAAEFDCLVELVSDDHGNPLIWYVEEGGVARFENDDALIFEHDLDVFLGEWAVGRRDACDLTFSEWAACFEVADGVVRGGCGAETGEKSEFVAEEARFCAVVEDFEPMWVGECAELLKGDECVVGDDGVGIDDAIIE